jgi:hypothetical protein
MEERFMKSTTGREVDEAHRRKLEDAVTRAEQDFYAEARESQTFGADRGTYPTTIKTETGSRWMFRIVPGDAPRGAHATQSRG